MSSASPRIAEIEHLVEIAEDWMASGRSRLAGGRRQRCAARVGRDVFSTVHCAGEEPPEGDALLSIKCLEHVVLDVLLYSRRAL